MQWSAAFAIGVLVACPLVGCSDEEGPVSPTATGGSGANAVGGSAGEGAGAGPSGGAGGGAGAANPGGAGGGEHNPPAFDFGYYNVDTVRWGSFLPEVVGWSNLFYAGGADAGYSDTTAEERRTNLAALVDRAAAAGFEIMLDIELGGPLTVGDVLVAAEPHWDRVKYVILGDELDMTVAEANAEIALLRERMQNLGLDAERPVGVTLTPAVTLSSEVVDAAWDFINIEAYSEPCSCGACGAATAGEEIAAVGERVAQMKARISSATDLTIVMQGYDRNGAYTNIPALALLDRATYFEMAKGDPRVKAIVVFSWGREGNQCDTGADFGFGSRGHPELQAVHQEIWADLTAGG